MLQYIAETNGKYNIAEQAQMAIEGGCTWVRLRVPDLDDAEVRELAQELIPLCKETSTILTIEDRIELAKELGIHGVHLRNSEISAAQAREICGPEAIIGVEIGLASDALALQNLDVDYISMDKTIEDFEDEIDALRSANFLLPVVADGNWSMKSVQLLKEMNVNGVGMGKPIADAADPVAKTQKVLEILLKK